jgi:hypothetical protein
MKELNNIIERLENAKNTMMIELENIVKSVVCLATEKEAEYHEAVKMKKTKSQNEEGVIKKMMLLAAELRGI